MLWRRAAAAAALNAALIAAYLVLHDAPFAAAIEEHTLNWRFRMRGAIEPPARVAVLAVDERSLAALHRWPLPRSVLAEAVAKLEAAGAAAIGFDLLFAEPEPSADRAGDRALAEALAASRGPVLAVALSFDRAAGGAGHAAGPLRDSMFRIVERPRDPADAPVLEATGAVLPIEPLRAEAALGHVNVPVDEDGALHNLHVAIGFEDGFVPALPVVLAARALGLGDSQIGLALGRGLYLGGRFVPLDRRSRMPLNLYGPPGRVATYSIADLFDGAVPREAISGRAVLIGATALGLGDTFVGPYSAAQPGVEILATAVGNLIDGTSLRRDASTGLVDVVAIAALGLAAFAAAYLASSIGAAGAVAVLLALWFGAAQLAFEGHNLWLNLTFPAAAIVLNAGLVVAARAVTERRLRRAAERERANLMRFHSPVIAARLADSAGEEFKDRERQAAILFVDLAGFTGRSERAGPGAVARMLRELHRRIEHAVLAHEGVLDQFIGDGAMVIFGIPERGATDAAAALACARDLARDLESWSASLAAAGEEPLSFGIGIHYGPVVITRLGGEAQLQLTAAGDTVNVASRIEAATRRHDATIAVTDSVAAAVRSAGRAALLDGFEARPGEAIRGRDRPVDLWLLRRR